VRDLVAEKRRWIDTFPAPTLARRRCHAIRGANELLAAHVGQARQDLTARIGPLSQAVHAREVLAAREYPWCFFPEKTLRTFLLLETC
jgi:hypothetical protein